MPQTKTGKKAFSLKIFILHFEECNLVNFYKEKIIIISIPTSCSLNGNYFYLNN